MIYGSGPGKGSSLWRTIISSNESALPRSQELEHQQSGVETFAAASTRYPATRNLLLFIAMGTRRPGCTAVMGHVRIDELPSNYKFPTGVNLLVNRFWNEECVKHREEFERIDFGEVNERPCIRDSRKSHAFKPQSMSSATASRSRSTRSTFVRPTRSMASSRSRLSSRYWARTGSTHRSSSPRGFDRNRCYGGHPNSVTPASYTPTRKGTYRRGRVPQRSSPDPGSPRTRWPGPPRPARGRLPDQPSPTAAVPRS